ncbi:MAG: response regulator transcription factor [Blastocatellia bacterium]
MKVLIVDDSQPMRQLLHSVIGHLADEIYECSDGNQALAAYGEHQPDWVLMDIKMNGLDGLAATREVTTQFPKAKVVIVTNFDDAETREVARESGAVGFVAKENLLELRLLLAMKTE